jgi:PHP family Zn ribbon phosphoesterase
MSGNETNTSCSQCGAHIEEPQCTPVEARAPCPACGSLARTLNVHVQDVLTPTLREKIGLKHKHPDHKKPIYELVTGDDLHRNSDQWNHLTREIDRLNNRYKEVILNPTTGEVIRSVDEPLTEHTGRGSAKPKVEGSRGA